MLPNADRCSPYALMLFDRAILEAADDFEAFLQECASRNEDPATYMND